MTPAAQAHYDRGLDLYRQQRYPAAAAELRRGFDLEPRREFLFAEAQAWRLAGDCGRALPLYRQFIASQPPAVQIEAAYLGIDRCESHRGPPADGRMLSPPAAPPPRRAPSAWWQGERGWWTAAMGAGTIALGVGLAYLVASNRARDEALSSRTTSYARFDEVWETAQQRRTVGLTALVGGALLVAAGGTRLLLLRHRSLSVNLGSAGPLLTWQGTF